MLCISDRPSQGIQDDSAAAVRLNSNVFLVEQDGLARILDFERSRFYGLDRVATRLLTSALARGPAQAAEFVAGEYGVSVECVRGDLDRLLRQLVRCKVLQSEEPRRVRCPAHGLIRMVRNALGSTAGACTPGRLPAAGETPGLSRMRIALLLVGIWVSLRLLGWNRTLAVLRRRHRFESAVSDCRCAAAVEAVDRAVRDVAARSVLLPMACKERSVAGWHLLRSVFGLPASIVVGYQLHPFEGHAWVESHGEPLTDDAEHCRMFTPIARYQ